MEKTLAIIKPDCVKGGNIGKVISMIEEKGLKIVAVKMVELSRKEAEGFYYVHKDKPFFESLISFMTEGPVVLMALSGENAISRWREIMGATDPAKAEDGTIRKSMGTNIERNCVHGSDSPESAKFEVNYFFSSLEIFE